MLSDTRRNNITCHTRHTTRHNMSNLFSSTFKWNGTRNTRHTLFFLKKIYIYYFLKNASVTCATYTILPKNMQKHSVTLGVTCRDMCDVLNFRCKGIFWRKMHLELRITQISESGFSFSQASYCISLLVKL